MQCFFIRILPKQDKWTAYEKKKKIMKAPSFRKNFRTSCKIHHSVIDHRHIHLFRQDPLKFNDKPHSHRGFYTSFRFHIFLLLLIISSLRLRSSTSLLLSPPGSAAESPSPPPPPPNGSITGRVVPILCDVPKEMVPK